MGKFSRILREMVKVRTVAAILLGAFLAHPVVPNASAATFLEIAIAGAPDHGIFDPSVASDGAGKLYMSLSGVASTTPGGGFGTAAVRTYLASSGDQGKSWQLAGVINPDIAVVLGTAPTNGRWQSEVSALVYDAQASAQARWKLIWHQYLNIDGVRKFEHGWIAYKEAATPGALATAKPVKLFTAAAYDAVNDNPAGWTRSPIAGAGVNKVQQLALRAPRLHSGQRAGPFVEGGRPLHVAGLLQIRFGRHYQRRGLAKMRTSLQRSGAERMVVCRNGARAGRLQRTGLRQILGLRPLFR